MLAHFNTCCLCIKDINKTKYGPTKIEDPQFLILRAQITFEMGCLIQQETAVGSVEILPKYCRNFKIKFFHRGSVAFRWDGQILTQAKYFNNSTFQ